MKRAFIFLLVMSAFMTCTAAYTEGELIEVQAQGSGISREQAMMNALEEALRKTMGTMILSREEIINDELTAYALVIRRSAS